MTHTFASVQAAYDDYLAAKQAARARITAEVRAEVNRRVEDENRRELERLSRLLHEAYRAGMTKAELRNATRRYTNSAAFNELWFAAPGAPTARVGRPVVTGEYSKSNPVVAAGQKPWSVEKLEPGLVKITIRPGIAGKKPTGREWKGPDVETETEAFFRPGFRGWTRKDWDGSEDVWSRNRWVWSPMIEAEIGEDGKAPL